MIKLFVRHIQSELQQQCLDQVLQSNEIEYIPGTKPGEIMIQALPSEKMELLRNTLQEKGLYMSGDRKYTLAEKIKHVVMEMLTQPESPRENYSDYISARIGLNYVYLANIFSEFNNITIEHFIIGQKIEKAKKLLLHSDYNIGQIADALNYSSIGHFSNQFKKVIGLNPTEFKKLERRAVA